jgi:1A family penicillin-binding protein
MTSHDHESENQLPTASDESIAGGSVKVRRNPLRVLRRRLLVARGRMLKTRRQRIIATAGALSALFIGVAVGGPLLWFRLNKLPDIRQLEQYVPIQSVRVYDRYDKLAAVVNGDQDRRPIKLSQVSPQMIKSMIGAEDHDFYHHGGINPSSIMRALIVNWKAHRIVEGGSTITQQLVKNLFFPGEKRTINRKIKEFFLANDVARKYPKDKILEMYLNQIYFGNQSYGIESAAQRYFSKSASKLTLGESTFLSGLVRSPSFLSNPEHRQLAFTRQHQVLDQMVGYGMISKDDADKAKAEKLAFRKFVNPYQRYPYYISYVMDELRDHYGEQELQHGLNVYTSLDPVAQVQAEQVMSDGIAHAPNGITQGALVSLKVADAGVVAMVGGVGGYEGHQWNRAVSPHTMGSSFKPFVYLTGLMKGLTPDSIIPDEPFSAPSGGQWYSPRNFDNSFMGPLTLKRALTQSRNVCAVRVAWFAGIKNVIDTAHRAGLTSRLDPFLPTAVGACAASPLEMAGAYSTFARGGVVMTPHLVRRIDNPDGKHIYTYNEKPHKAFDSRAVSELVDCMQNVVQHGTGVKAQLPGRPVAGKTGTADKSKDIWFIGFTPDTCTACWGGNDHNHAIGNRSVTGGMVMAGMWKKYMVSYYDSHPTPAGSFMQRSENVTQIAMSNEDASAARRKGIVPVNAVIGNNDSANDKTTKSADNAKTDAKAADGNKDKAKVASNDAKDDNAATLDNDAKDDRDEANAKTAADTDNAVTNNDTDNEAKQKPKRPRKLIARKTDSNDEANAEQQAQSAEARNRAAARAESEQAAEHAAAAADDDATPRAQAPRQRVAPPMANTRVPVRVVESPQAVYVRAPDGQIYLMPVQTRRVIMPAPAMAPAPVVIPAPAMAPAPVVIPAPAMAPPPVMVPAPVMAPAPVMVPARVATPAAAAPPGSEPDGGED